MILLIGSTGIELRMLELSDSLKLIGIQPVESFSLEVVEFLQLYVYPVGRLGRA